MAVVGVLHQQHFGNVPQLMCALAGVSLLTAPSPSSLVGEEHQQGRRVIGTVRHIFDLGVLKTDEIYEKFSIVDYTHSYSRL
jgi:hypothetical protein